MLASHRWQRLYRTQVLSRPPLPCLRALLLLGPSSVSCTTPAGAAAFVPPAPSRLGRRCQASWAQHALGAARGLSVWRGRGCWVLHCSLLPVQVTVRCRGLTRTALLFPHRWAWYLDGAHAAHPRRLAGAILATACCAAPWQGASLAWRCGDEHCMRVSSSLDLQHGVWLWGTVQPPHALLQRCIQSTRTAPHPRAHGHSACTFPC